MELNKKQLDWLGSNDRGISSNTIFHVMGGTPKELVLGSLSPCYPLDPSDFGRCYRLLTLFPEWEDRLFEVADIYPDWKETVAHWTEWKKLWEEESPSGRCPKLYDAMQEAEERTQKKRRNI